MRNWLASILSVCLILPVFSQYKLKKDSADVKVSSYEIIYAKPFHSRCRYALRLDHGVLSMEVFLSNARVILPRSGSGNQDSVIFHGNGCQISYAIPILDDQKSHPRKKQFRFSLPLEDKQVLAFVNTPPSLFSIIHGDQRFDFNIGIAHYTRIKNRIKWMLL